MVNNNRAHRPGIRASLSAALFLVATSASAVTVDGDLSDLISAIGSEPYAPQNTVDASDPGNDAESNGFDITNGYAWYNPGIDTFFAGIKFAPGTFGTSGGTEGTPGSGFCGDNLSDGVAGVFDACENYGFSIQILSGSSATTGFTRLDISGDDIADSGPGTESGQLVSGNLGMTLANYNWAVSETDQGVEFSVTGLGWALGNYSVANPTLLEVGFYAGSGSGNFGAEDILLVDMQVVPVPATLWLFGSGLLGLIGFSRETRRAASQNISRG